MINRTFNAALTLLALVFAHPVWADFQLNMTEGVTSTSREIHSLHMMMLTVCALIAAGVYAAMVYAIVKFRKSAGAQAREILSQHHRRGDLDRHPGRHPRGYGRSGRRDAREDGGHAQFAS